MKASLRVIAITALTVADVIIGGIIINDDIRKDSKMQNRAVMPIVEPLELAEVDLVVAKEANIEEEEPKEIESTPEELPVVEEKEEEKVVYAGMTLQELGDKLDRSLNDTIAGKGYLIASYALEKKVDPYIATAIMLLETGCTWHCSNLVTKCNNVGGQVGSGCGSYRSFPTLEAGIKGFIDNLSKNYFAKGLDTPEEINKKYATDKSWYKKVNSYIKKIKNK